MSVNGATVRELGTKADAAHDDIRVDGRRVKPPERHRYILLNKPRGYVTTRSDPERRPTVLDLLRGVDEYVYPVGRLDYASEGLLILTNDGDLAARLTHPRHGVARVYEARVLGVPDAHDLDRLSRGVTIDGRRTDPGGDPDAQRHPSAFSHARGAPPPQAGAGARAGGEAHGERQPSPERESLRSSARSSSPRGWGPAGRKNDDRRAAEGRRQRFSKSRSAKDATVRCARCARRSAIRSSS